MGPKALKTAPSREFVKRKRNLLRGEEFAKIQGTTGFAWSWNTMAAVCGPLWGACAWSLGLLLDLSWFSNSSHWCSSAVDCGASWARTSLPGTSGCSRTLRKREQQAKEALGAGDQAAADSALKIAENLKKVVAQRLKEAAEAAAGEAVTDDPC